MNLLFLSAEALNCLKRVVFCAGVRGDARGSHGIKRAVEIMCDKAWLCKEIVFSKFFDIQSIYRRCLSLQCSFGGSKWGAIRPALTCRSIRWRSCSLQVKIPTHGGASDSDDLFSLSSDTDDRLLRNKVPLNNLDGLIMLMQLIMRNGGSYKRISLHVQIPYCTNTHASQFNSHICCTCTLALYV